MPALVKSKFGAVGSRLAEGTMVCRFSRKKSKNDCLISEAFMIKRPDAESPRSAKNCRGSRGNVSAKCWVDLPGSRSFTEHSVIAPTQAGSLCYFTLSRRQLGCEKPS